MLLKLLGIIDEDCINYKKISMTLEFPYCSFKCNKDWGYEVCQNSYLQSFDLIEIDSSELIKRYLNNPISESVVMQGLEPFDSFEDLVSFIQEFRDVCDDEIVIYTGYYVEEIKDKLKILQKFDSIIIKFGRYIPNDVKHIDPILHVPLASSNQYAEYLNKIVL